nr:MAG TPA: hypothetical protein [Caudoviricetes sp.]
MDEVTIWLIAIPLIILEIVMIVKFFQIASDIRALKHYLVDCYKNIKGKDEKDLSFELTCYKEDLLKTIPYEQWKKTREDILKPVIEAYNKEHYNKEYYQRIVQESKENSDNQETEKDNHERNKTIM